jgi:RNA polymerase sigma-70 factor (ECF subfamily)
MKICDKSAEKVSQMDFGRCCMSVDASGEAIAEMNSGEAEVDLAAIFYAQYERLARVIAGVIRDRARAEELAVEVFLKWSTSPKAHRKNPEGWLYRTAVRTALNELRSELRRARYETLFGFFSFARRAPTPEDVHASSEMQQRVRSVLNVIGHRHAELLLLRNEGLSYDEVAKTLDIHPASIGTLLSRAQQAFRKEYRRRYGEE